MSGPKLYSFKVDNAPQKLDSNQFFLPAGIHSSLREYTYSCCGGTKNLVEQVQKALNTNGYSIIEDNTLDEATRNALIDYQKKNDLPVGNLNVETLKHLGIKGY